ncbi:MAG: hypothetical protein Q9184_004942 [Pyrenodesmia sp. 2 TL-2023]
MANPNSAPPTPRSAPISRSPSPPPSPLPLTSPLRTHPKRNLPISLASTYPHGHLGGHPRTPSQQRNFEARKAEILATMTAEQIEKRYVEVTEKVKAVLAEEERRRQDVEGKMEKLRKEREVERRVYEKVKGKREGG